MADIKLFRTDGLVPVELESSSVSLEKALQNRIEQHLDVFFGVRFLASEYSTGVKHGGRIDTLGIDENNAPVIIEYKRSAGDNIMNQGLFYLDWLLDHRVEFEVLASKTLNEEVEVEWGSPRVLCIANDFKKYDIHAVRHIGRNIELIRYRRYDGLLLFELVYNPDADKSSATSPAGTSGAGSSGKTVGDYLAQASEDLTARFQALEEFCLSLGDDVTRKELKHYFAFRRIKNFACVEVHPGGGHLLVYVKVDPDEVDLIEGVTRDVRGVGHFGTGDLEIRLTADEHLDIARNLIAQSYEIS